MSAADLRHLPNRIGSIAKRLTPAAPRLPEQPRTVLIVDDEETICTFLDRVLRSAGYTTAVAGSGPEAVRTAANCPSLDLLVTDMMMPEMVGSELARVLRQSHPDLKVLYFTGFSDRLFDEKVTMWDDEAFLEKPCSVAGILEAVSLLWSHRTSAPVNRSSERGNHEAHLAG